MYLELVLGVRHCLGDGLAATWVDGPRGSARGEARQKERQLKKQIPFGKYMLLDRINVGGMAEVYKAKTLGVEGFERLLAIKRILPNIAEDDEFIAMFIDEAKISVQLTHSNIAQIYDLGKIGDAYFIAMEYISGKDLRSIFDKMRMRGEHLPIPMTCYVLSKLCEGLDYAHRKKDAAGRPLSIIHRDVSPQNILVSYEGEVKIIDFGIAKAANKASRTQAGILKGKFGYMSPEQVRGLPIDHRSDVFAAGVCLYEQLTGERLFQAESDFSTLEKVRNVDIELPSTFNSAIPQALERIVMRALAKDVEDRYEWCSDLGDDLQRFLITSDSIFSRSDLANFMKAAFAEDLEKEKLKNQQALLDDGDGGELDLGDLEEEAPSAADPEDSTQLFDPTTEFDQLPGSPSQKDEPRPSAPPPRTPSPAAPRPPAAGPPPGLGQAPSRPGGSPPPGFRPGAKPAPHPQSKTPPVIGRGAARGPSLHEAARGSLVGPENNDEEGPPTVAEGIRSPRASSPRPTARHAASAAKKRAGWKVPFLSGLAVLVLVGAVMGGVRFMGSGVGSPTGILIVSGDPVGAKVVLDGEHVGDMPFVDTEAIIGGRALMVTSEGYEPHEERVVVLPGQTASISVSLQESGGKPASLLVVSVPLDARVRFNDKVVKEGGDSPWQSRDIRPNEAHTIVVEKDGYWPRTVEWTPEPGEEKNLTVTLNEAEAELVVTSRPSRAGVFIDGRQVGRTPLKLDEMDGSRTYDIEVKGVRCFEDWSSVLDFDGEAKKRIQVELEEIPGCRTATKTKRPRRPRPGPSAPAKTVTKQQEGSGLLSVNTRPGWAWVIIDGEETGRHTPLINHELPAGEYTILVRAPDGRENTARVTIRPDEITRRTIDLD